MKSHRRLVTLLFSVALAGCGSGGGGGKDAGPGGGAGGGGGTGGGSAGGAGGGGGLVPLSSFCGTAATRACAHLQSCGLLGAAQVPECRARFEARCAVKVRASDAGTLRYDAVAATDCVASTANAPCYGGPEDLRDCLDAVFPEAGRVGAPCDGRGCIEGYCPLAFGSDVTCRACTAFVGQGQPCTQPNQCNPAVGFCAQSAADGGPPACAPLRGPGTACLTGYECAGRANCVNFGPIDGGIPRCGPVSLGTPCASAGDCGSGAFCKGLRIAADDTTTLGACTARIALNAACTNQQYDDGCQGAGATCINSVCVTTPPHSRPLSGECDQYDQCPIGAYCTCAGPIADDGGISLRDGSCLSQQGDGGGCWVEDDYSMCLAGLECTPNRLCVPLRTEGQSCGPMIGTCLSFLNCTQELTPGAPTCVAARKPGESCSAATLPCGTGAFCAADGGCAAMLAAGGTCAAAADCQSLRCLSADAGKVCGASCF